MKKEAPSSKIKQKGNKANFALILINDELNTFTHVIKTLVEVCGHDECQAEQCAILTHLKGRCEVRVGTRVMLHSMSRTLKSKGLKSKIETL